MAGKADFTEEEWDTLHKATMGAGLLVSMSDRAFFDSFKEAGALAKHVASARHDQQSELLRDLAKEGGTGFGVRSRPEEVERETLEGLRSAVDMLQTKAPDELDGYRAFVLEIAQSVASAAGGGDEKEAQAVERVREAVGATG